MSLGPAGEGFMTMLVGGDKVDGHFVEIWLTRFEGVQDIGFEVLADVRKV